MTTKALLRHAKTLFHCGIPHLDRHNQRAWVRSVIRLGDRWLLAKHVHRIQHL
jgi:hypothetical protein